VRAVEVEIQRLCAGDRMGTQQRVADRDQRVGRAARRAPRWEGALVVVRVSDTQTIQPCAHGGVEPRTGAAHVEEQVGPPPLGGSSRACSTVAAAGCSV
jgi:hypothetical protein